MSVKPQRLLWSVRPQLQTSAAGVMTTERALICRWTSGLKINGHAVGAGTSLDASSSEVQAAGAVQA